jgi:2-keto-4-pentenoate hydratase
MADGEPHATRILAALDAGRETPPPSDEDPSFDDRRGYAVAAELQRLREARGAVVVGRKIGFTNPMLMARYGVTTPIVGAIYDRGLSSTGGEPATLAIGDLQQVRIEPEIQLHFASSPQRGATEEEMLACVDWIAHGFEFVQCPYPGFRFRSADAIACGSLHARLLVGPRLPTAGAHDLIEQLRAFRIVLRSASGEEAHGCGADVLGSPLLAAAAMPELPRAGEIISTGSLTDAIGVAPGQTWTTELDGIPLRGLMVRLT